MIHRSALALHIHHEVAPYCSLLSRQAVDKTFVSDICRAPVSRTEMDQAVLDRVIAAHLFQQVGWVLTLGKHLPVRLLTQSPWCMCARTACSIDRVQECSSWQPCACHADAGTLRNWGRVCEGGGAGVRGLPQAALRAHAHGAAAGAVCSNICALFGLKCITHHPRQ
jgi:hypothetical protein